MSAPFLEASALRDLEDGGFEASIPDGWQQGRGAFGGLVLALLSRGMLAREPERPLRALTAELCGAALAGPASVVVESLRSGRRLSFLGARLLQGGKLIARASAVLGADQDIPPSREGVFLEAPSPMPWREVAETPPRAPMGPAFAHHFEYRPVGPLPFSGAPEPLAGGWIRLREAPEVLDTPAILALLDAWWPAQFSIEEGPRPAATVSFTAELHSEGAGLPGNEPLFHRAFVSASQGGFFVEHRELWSGARLVAQNQQTFIILG